VDPLDLTLRPVVVNQSSFELLLPLDALRIPLRHCFLRFGQRHGPR